MSPLFPKKYGILLKNMEYIKAEIAKPNPKSTINSYRSFGYNLSTAISDIVDNSISANANDFFFHTCDDL